MEAETTDLLRQHNESLDNSMQNVMPDRWAGHGRLLVHDSDLSPSEKDTAIDAINNLARKKPKQFKKHGSEKVAEKVISKVAGDN